FSFYFPTLPRPPISTLFPYTTLFRSRTHPNGPWIYTGGPAWEFQWVPGDEFPVFDTVHGKVGLAMCSEVYMPEVARALALRGAEDRKSTRLNSSHLVISYAVFCLKKK